jgi:hypothetical protein
VGTAAWVAVEDDVANRVLAGAREMRHVYRSATDTSDGLDAIFSTAASLLQAVLGCSVLSEDRIRISTG